MPAYQVKMLQHLSTRDLIHKTLISEKVEKHKGENFYAVRVYFVSVCDFFKSF